MKHSGEFNAFTNLVDRVLAVPHSVIKQLANSPCPENQRLEQFRESVPSATGPDVAEPAIERLSLRQDGGELRERAAIERSDRVFSLDIAPPPSPSVPTIPDGQRSSNAHLGLVRRLNPAFVAWLMGLPWWWTNPEPINCGRPETASYLCRQRRLLFYLLGGQN